MSLVTPSASGAAVVRMLGRASRVPLPKRLWRALPVTARRRVFSALAWTGIPMLANYLASYRRAHDAALFAGGLGEILERFADATPDERAALLARFDAIVDAIVLPNGVRKTTYADRATALLARILDDPACALPERDLRVLDLPASTGAASLDARALLARHRRVVEYVLADLDFHLLLDRTRGCVFDADHRLLQALRGRSYVSTAVPHAEGEEWNPLTRTALLPLRWRAARLTSALRATDAPTLEALPLLRPDVLERCRAGDFTLRELDVFAPIPGAFDLILSFNLLQPNYFSETTIARGRENLGKALAPGGLLVIGSPDAGGVDAHRVYRRVGAGLTLVRAVS